MRTMHAHTERVSHCEQTNVFGVRRVTDALLPLLKRGGRVVNVSSTIGVLNSSYSPAIVEQLRDASLSFERFESLANSFIQATATASHVQLGWRDNTYAVSKAMLNQLTRLFAETNPERFFFSVDPGWCRTDMGGKDAPLSAQDGANRVLDVALAQNIEQYNGLFYRNGKPTKP
jgi:NAD(P)-dependent dehydrogenase (short-subunit alcohol dehydrogenase family)